MVVSGRCLENGRNVHRKFRKIFGNICVELRLENHGFFKKENLEGEKR